MIDENQQVVERCRAVMFRLKEALAGNEDAFNHCILLAWQIGGDGCAGRSYQKLGEPKGQR